MDSWNEKPRVFAAFATPTFLWLFGFFIVPLAIIWLYSFGENVSLTEIETTWTLENYRRILEPEIFKLLIRSFWLSGISTLICLIVGFPVALVIATSSAKWKPWLLLIIILPFWTNLLIRTYALLNILGTRGRLNQAFEYIWSFFNGLFDAFGLENLNPMGERFIPFKFLGTPSGVVIGLVYVSLPFAVLPIYASLERLNRSYLEASMDLGAGQFRTFFSILVPLTMGGIVTAAIITFIPALGSFLTPDLLGRGQVDMIANVIERQFKRANDWPFGSAISLLLLYVTFIILAVRAWMAAREAEAQKVRG